MKTFKLLSRLMSVCVIVMLTGISGWADEIQTDNFDADLESWTGNISRVNFSGSQRMRIARDGTASKTFAFTSPDYTNANVTLSFNLLLDDDWETDDDVYVYANGIQIAHYNHEDGSYNKTLSTTTNASGQLLLQIITDTSSDSEYAYIDNISVTAVGPVAQTPPIMGNVPNQVVQIGIPYTLNLSTYVTLTNADPLIAPYYTLTGTLPAGLDFNSTTGVISGTATTAASAVTFNVTATDNDGVSNSDSFTITVTAATNSYRDFTLRKQLYAKGNMKTIGNTVMVLPTNGQNCTTYTNGTYNANSTSANGDVDLCAYSVDGTQTNATTAELALPANAKVIWAGLYWQGVMINAINPNMQVKIRQNSGSYVSVDVDALNYRDEGWDYTAGNGIHYAAFADVTDLFGEGKWNEGNYTVSDIPVVENGNENGLGTYGAWSLVAIYEDPAEKFRSYSVFDGWKQVTATTDAVIPISGFYTPNRTLDSSAAKVSVFTAEGDRPYTGDQLITKNYNTNTNVALETIANNTFNSSVTGGGVRTPNATNNFGIDIQSFDIGNLLTPKQTDMSFTFTSTQDVYWPSMIAVSTELVAPQLCYDYSYKQDGAYLKVDNNGTQLPLITGFVSNSPIDTSIYVRNNEADIKAQGVSFYTDVNASVFQYIDNSVYTSNINGSALIARTDTTGGCHYTDSATTPIGCNNGANIRIGLGKDATGYSQSGAGSLGDREFVYAKFSMDPIGVSGIMDINQSVGLHLNYYIVPKTGAAAIPYDYEFGTDIPLCPPTSGYEPTWGTFNVVESGAASIGGLPVNNIRTKVSRNPFNVDVATYGKNTVTGKYDVLPTTNVNTTLLVEMIDSGAYHDANATCANPDAVISQSIFVPITASSTEPTDPVPLQNTEFHNFAVQNGAFRIWYFDDANQTLIQNWTAATSDATRLNLTSINGLYKSSFHTQCATECVASTSVGCFECIKANYAKPLCSRDNFAVRPESYDLRIYDINQTLAKTDPVKDSTKIALSEQYQYPPTFAAATGRVNLAAGYDYRYDMNATGHDTDLSKVPGYTRYFNGTNSEYNATMIWEPSSPKTGCNNENSRPLTFYVANGQMSNEEAEENEVGEYRANIIDTAWTEVDWKSSLIGHHLSTNGFEADPVDCIIGTTSTVLSGGKIGCTVSSSADAVTPHINGTQTYKDHLLTFKPAKFDLTGVTYALGMNAAPITVGGTGFVYDSNLSIANDMPMAVRSSGSIKALGYNDAVLSNFVTECYASDINVSISHDANATYNFMGRIDTNATYNATTSPAQTIAQSSFAKADNGAISPTIRLNVDRDVRVPQLPLIVQYNDQNVSCANAVDCNVSAMSLSVPNTATGSKAMDFNVTHVYGRVVPNSVRVMGLIAFETIARYEAYMTPDLLGTPLLADPVDATWYVNTLHTEAGQGDATVGYVDPVSGSSLPTITSAYAAGVETYRFNPYTIRKNYKGHINTEGWLWYNPNALAYIDPDAANLSCLTHPCFDIIFGRLIGNTGSAKTESETHKANKATSTGTGWSTTSEYAPAIR